MYVHSDVADLHSVQSLLVELRAAWPPISGIVNGAMVLHDSSLVNMTFEQMSNTLRPKVVGSQVLDEVFSTHPLDFFILIGSLTCVIGNAGQSAYSAANLYMSALVSQRRQRGLAASIIHIGLILGAGYGARKLDDSVTRQLERMGSMRLSERDFHIAFSNAIHAGSPDSEYGGEVIVGLNVSVSASAGHFAWMNDARFGHLRLPEETPEAEGVSNNIAAEPPRARLRQVESYAAVHAILTGECIRHRNGVF